MPVCNPTQASPIKTLNHHSFKTYTIITITLAITKETNSIRICWKEMMKQDTKYTAYKSQL